MFWKSLRGPDGHETHPLYKKPQINVNKHKSLRPHTDSYSFPKQQLFD